MNTFRLLGSASCVAILVSAGTAEVLAGPPIQVEVPVRIQTVDTRAIESVVGFDLSTFNAGTIVPGISAGIRANGLGNGQFSIGVDGGFGLRQPGNVTELSVVSRLGFRPTDLSTVEVLTGGGVGAISGSPFYQFNAGAEFGLSPVAGILVEGVVRGPFGVTPTDFGVHTSVRLYPGRFGSNYDYDTGGVFESGYITHPGTVWAGPSVTVIPSASAVIPAIDAGFNYKVADKFDLGLRGSLGMQFPAGTYEASAGGEVGYELTPALRGLLFGEVGTIGGFIFNRVGVGAEFKATPTFSLVGELSGRGAPGTLTEGGFKFGGRYTLAPESDWEDPITIDIGPTAAAPEFFIGKSLGVIPTGGYVIPSIEAGVTLPLHGSGFETSLRGELGYVHPSGDILGLAGVDLGYQLTPDFKLSGGVGVGSIGGFPINRISLGGQYNLNDSFALRAEGFAQGGLGTLSESGLKVALRYIHSNLAAGN
jgi:hypothetical protein